jgi:hypothetical protein
MKTNSLQLNSILKYIKELHSKEFKELSERVLLIKAQWPYCLVRYKDEQEELLQIPLFFLEKYFSGHMLKVHRAYLINAGVSKELILHKDTKSRTYYTIRLNHEHSAIELPVGRKYLTGLLKTCELKL